MAITRRTVQAGRWFSWGGTRFVQRPAERNLDTKTFRAETGLQVAPVAAAVSVLANTAAASDVVVERMSSSGQWERHSSRLPAWADPERRPNPWQTQGGFLFNLVTNRLVSGNGYVRIVSRDWYGGWPNQIVSVPFRSVSVTVAGVETTMSDRLGKTPGRTIPGYGGTYDDIYYFIDGSDQLSGFTSLTAPRGDVLHTRMFTREDLVFGLGPLHWGAPPVRTALAGDAYAEIGLLQGFFPPGILFNKGKVDATDMARTRKAVGEIVRRPDRRFLPLFATGDWEYLSTYVKPDELQLMDSRKLAWPIVSALFGVPKELIGAPDTSVSGTGIRNLQRAFAQMTAVPLLNAVGSDLSELLPTGYRVRLKPRHLLELDPLEESRVHDRLVRLGVLKPSEVREEMGLPPIAGLDDEVCPLVVGGSGGQADEGGQSDSGRDETDPNERNTKEDM